MKILKIISAESHSSLEATVNQWLEDNKNITIHSSDLKVVPGEGYLFHILYTVGIVEEDGKLRSLAVVDPEAIAVTESGAVVEVITDATIPEKN